MATTVSGINAALVDEKVVQALRNVLPALEAFSFRCGREGMIQNDTVQVPLSTDPTAGTKTAGAAMTASGALAGTTVTLDTFTGAPWQFVQGAIAGALLENAVADKIAGGVYQCAKTVVDQALAVVTAGNFLNTDADKLVCAPGDFGQSDFASLWSKAEVKKLGRQRVLMLNALYAGALLGESNLGLILATLGNNFFATGVLPPMGGMSSICYAGLPTNSENLGGFVADKSAIAIAAFPPAIIGDPNEGGVSRRIVTEPESGLSVLLETTYAFGGALKGEVTVLSGVAKGTNSVIRLLSA